MRQSLEGDSLMAIEHSLLQSYVIEEQELGSPAGERVDHGCHISEWIQDGARGTVAHVVGYLFASVSRCAAGSKHLHDLVGHVF